MAVVPGVPGPGENGLYLHRSRGGQAARPPAALAFSDLIEGNIFAALANHDSSRRRPGGYRLTWYARAASDGVNTAAAFTSWNLHLKTCNGKVVGPAHRQLHFARRRRLRGARREEDGVILHHWPRRDGTIRDTVMDSVASPPIGADVKRHSSSASPDTPILNAGAACRVDPVLPCHPCAQRTSAAAGV